MYDNLKLMAKSLNATFKITIYLPFDYDKLDTYYKTLFIVSASNPFVDSNLELVLKEKNMLGIAIYPNLDIKKNCLLYNSFDTKYNFAKLYEEFILNEVLPLLKTKYRIDNKNESILGINDTSLLAYSLSCHYQEFSEVYLYNLSLDNHNFLITDFISTFNPNLAYFFKADETISNKLNNLLKDLGAPKWGNFNNITDLKNYL